MHLAAGANADLAVSPSAEALCTGVGMEAQSRGGGKCQCRKTDTALSTDRCCGSCCRPGRSHCQRRKKLRVSWMTRQWMGRGRCRSRHRSRGATSGASGCANGRRPCRLTSRRRRRRRRRRCRCDPSPPSTHTPTHTPLPLSISQVVLVPERTKSSLGVLHELVSACLCPLLTGGSNSSWGPAAAGAGPHMDYPPKR